MSGLQMIGPASKSLDGTLQLLQASGAHLQRHLLHAASVNQAQQKPQDRGEPAGPR